MEGKVRMQCSKLALVALVAAGLSTTAGIANAAIAATDMTTAVDRLTLVDKADFLFGGHRHCWYADGWNGPGWYWCGYRHRHGLGWGGGEGFHGWRHR
jgi:hypothetical protein